MQLRYSSDARESGWVRLAAVSRLRLGRGGGGGGGGGSGGGGGGGSGADGADAWEGVGGGGGVGGGASKRLFLKLRGSSLSAHPDEVSGCDVVVRWGWAAVCVGSPCQRGGGVEEERGCYAPQSGWDGCGREVGAGWKESAGEWLGTILGDASATGDRLLACGASESVGAMSNASGENGVCGKASTGR